MSYLPEDETRDWLGREDSPHLYWNLRMLCPACGEVGVEQYGPGGGDHTAVTVQPDRDDYVSPIGTRGGYTQIDLSCPAGHEFSLIIANHKGAQYIAAIRR